MIFILTLIAYSLKALCHLMSATCFKLVENSKVPRTLILVFKVVARLNPSYMMKSFGYCQMRYHRMLNDYENELENLFQGTMRFCDKLEQDLDYLMYDYARLKCPPPVRQCKPSKSHHKSFFTTKMKKIKNKVPMLHLTRFVKSSLM